MTRSKRPKRHPSASAVIVSLKHLDSEALALSTNAEFMEIIEQARREIADGQIVSLDEMKRGLLP